MTSMFPLPIRSEDSCGSMIWERGTEYGKAFWMNWEKSDSFENGGRKDWVDPIDLLPADPFNMELGSNLAAAIVGWFGDLGGHSCGCDQCSYFFNGHYGEYEYDDGWFADVVSSCHGVSSDVSTPVFEGAEAETQSGGPQPENGLPHEGLILSLGYLGVQDLLNVETVCKSLHSAVWNDPLLWRCIHIDSPLSQRLTDDALLRLTSRAHGTLQCLSLVACPNITNEGLKMVLDCNPKLQKLSISGCVRLKMEGLLDNLKAFKSSGVTGIKHLKLGKWFIVSPEQYEELQSLLGGEGAMQLKPSKPRFYHSISPIACDDDDNGRPTDIEMCPRCQRFTVLFDCPSESCPRKGDCRACDICIERCGLCGRCIEDCRYEETFLLDLVCSACCKQGTSTS